MQCNSAQKRPSPVYFEQSSAALLAILPLERPMWKSEIKPGTEYAIREQPSAPYQRIKVLEHIRGSKWKVKWIDPNPGLVDFIESKMIIVRWRELKALLKDEARERELREYDKKAGHKEGSPVALAVDEVIGATNETLGDQESVARLQARAGLNPPRHAQPCLRRAARARTRLLRGGAGDGVGERGRQGERVGT